MLLHKLYRYVVIALVWFIYICYLLYLAWFLYRLFLIAGPEVGTEVAGNLKVRSPRDVQGAVNQADAQGFSMKRVFNVLVDNRLLIFSGLLLLFTAYFAYLWWTYPVHVAPTGHDLVPVEVEATINRERDALLSLENVADAEMVAPVAVEEIHIIEEAALDMPVAAPLEAAPVMEELVLEIAPVVEPVLVVEEAAPTVPLNFCFPLYPLRDGWVIIDGIPYEVSLLMEDKHRLLRHAYIFHIHPDWQMAKLGIFAYYKRAPEFLTIDDALLGTDRSVLASLANIIQRI